MIIRDEFIRPETGYPDFRVTIKTRGKIQRIRRIRKHRNRRRRYNLKVIR